MNSIDLIRIIEKAIHEKNAEDVDDAVNEVMHTDKPAEIVPYLCKLLQSDWHYDHEDITLTLQEIGDPRAIATLKNTATDNFLNREYDNYLALARKCTWALADIGTQEAADALWELTKLPSKEISGFAKKRIRNWEQELDRKKNPSAPFRLEMHPRTGYIKDDLSFKILYENTGILAGHLYETAYCYNKITKEESAIFQFQGDPTCALIGTNNDWCLIGGDILVLRTWVDNALRLIVDIKDIYALKAIGPYTIQILTDPWSENSTIWQLDIDLTQLSKSVSWRKIKYFTEYFGKPYSEEIVW